MYEYRRLWIFVVSGCPFPCNEVTRQVQHYTHKSHIETDNVVELRHFFRRLSLLTSTHPIIVYNLDQTVSKGTSDMSTVKEENEVSE